MTNLVFDNPPPISQAEAEAAFATEQPDLIRHTLIGVALHDPDWHRVQAVCVRFAASSDIGIRGVVAACIGHLARLHHEADVDTLLPILERMLCDPETRGRAEDALDDMGIFLSSGESREKVARLKRLHRPD